MCRAHEVGLLEQLDGRGVGNGSLNVTSCKRGVLIDTNIDDRASIVIVPLEFCGQITALPVKYNISYLNAPFQYSNIYRVLARFSPILTSNGRVASKYTSHISFYHIIHVALTSWNKFRRVAFPRIGRLPAVLPPPASAF